MKKIINISVIAALAILPLAANATDYSVADPTSDANAAAASTTPKWQLAQAKPTADGKLATAGYVKGAYNQTMKAINAVATTASFAGTESELNDTHFASTDKTSAAKAANAAMAAAAAAQADVDAVEATIGDTALTTTAQTLTGAIEEVADEKADKATTLIGYGITDGADTALSNITNAGETVIKNLAAEGGYDNTENYTNGTIGATIKSLETNSLTAADIADFATQDGVENTIETATISANVPIVTTWGTDTETTLDVNVASISATYAEPTPTPAP